MFVLCLYYHYYIRGALGEEVLYDVVNELSVVANNATSMIRGKDKPIGLVNAHNTCYLNVLLHCLYAIWPFRSRLYHFFICIMYRMSINVKDTSSLLYVLQKTFGYMTLSKCLSFYPDELIRVLGIDPDIQCDVHEFFHGFIADLKQAILSANPDYQLVSYYLILSYRRTLIPFSRVSVCNVVVVWSATKCSIHKKSFPF